MGDLLRVAFLGIVFTFIGGIALAGAGFFLWIILTILLAPFGVYLF